MSSKCFTPASLQTNEVPEVAVRLDAAVSLRGNCDERAVAQEVHFIQSLLPRASAVAGGAHGRATPSGSANEIAAPKRPQLSKRSERG